MSSISGVSSTTNPYQNQSQNSFGQAMKSFQAIGSALQSGNLSTAQSALATFQKDLPANAQNANSSSSTANSPFGSNSQANNDYQNLTTALKSGNLSDAQKAFSSLQTDLSSTKSTKSTHRGHHHHHAESASSSTTATDSTSSTSTTTGTTSDSTASTGSTCSTTAGILNTTA